MKRSELLPSISFGCLAHADAGSASISARSRSASKRTGRRKNGFASFIGSGALGRLAEVADRLDDLGHGGLLRFGQVRVPQVEDQHDSRLLAAIPCLVLERV